MGAGDSFMTGFITTYFNGKKNYDALTAADPAKFADGAGRKEYMHDLINCAMSTGNLVAITTCFTHGAFGNGVKYEK